MELKYKNNEIKSTKFTYYIIDVGVGALRIFEDPGAMGFRHRWQWEWGMTIKNNQGPMDDAFVNETSDIHYATPEEAANAALNWYMTEEKEE